MTHQASHYASVVNDKAINHSVWEESQVTQKEPLNSAQIKNNEGGYVFKMDPLKQVERFLILGTERPSYYASAQKLTVENAQNILDLIKSGHSSAIVKMAVEISQAGRAPKNAPAVFALALVATTVKEASVVAEVFEALPLVCRTATDLFAFVEILDKHGKWNAAAKRGVAKWYLDKKVDQVAYQAVKYQQRNGWAHRDVLRLAHVKPNSEEMSALFYWITKDRARKEGAVLPKLIDLFEELKATSSAKNLIKLIQENKVVSWEMIPTTFYKDPDVWEALLPNMGYTALIRKLGQLSSVGLMAPLSNSFKIVRDKLQDSEALKKGRIHPIFILNALAMYKKGSGEKGSLTWKANNQLVDVLTEAFYGSFATVEPTGQNYLLGVDCSSSMWGAQVAGTALSSAEVAACMALAIARVEQNYWIGGFNTSMGELKISPKMTLDQVLKTMQKFRWGGTDCAQPMLHAMSQKMFVDKFCVYTDNETHSGRVHPSEALKRYRKEFVPTAKLIVAGTSATQFSIADPADAGMLDIVGFDSAAPQLIATF